MRFARPQTLSRALACPGYLNHIFVVCRDGSFYEPPEEVHKQGPWQARRNAGANDPLFARHKGGGRLSARTVNYMLKRTAIRVGLNHPVSAHWLRHAHGSHALDRGATLAEVQATLGHSNVATTSVYLHARPDSSSGLYLDPGVFRE